MRRTLKFTQCSWISDQQRCLLWISASMGLTFWSLLSFSSCQQPGILVWLPKSYKQVRLHSSAKLMQGNTTRAGAHHYWRGVNCFKLIVREGMVRNVLARSWSWVDSRTYVQNQSSQNRAKYDTVYLTRLKTDKQSSLKLPDQSKNLSIDKKKGVCFSLTSRVIWNFLYILRLP